MGDTASFATNIAPWLMVHDAEAALDFYSTALDATETYRLDEGGEPGRSAALG